MNARAPRRVPLAERLYRLLLRIFYSSGFCRCHVDDATELFRDRYRAEAAHGRGALLVLWTRTLLDVMVHGSLERLNALVRPAAERRRRQGRRRTPHLVAQDMRYAVRTLTRRPGFTLVLVITLGLGIGATTAIFTVLNAVLLRPLPFEEPDRLVQMWETNAELGLEREGPSPGNFLQWEERADGFDAMASWYLTSGTFRDGTTMEESRGAQVTPDFFRVLGVEAALGRTFYPDEVLRGGRSVVLSDRMWRRVFAADPNIIGRRILLSANPYQVVGVMPPSFEFPDASVNQWSAWDFRIAYARLESVPRSWRFLRTIGRLRDGTDLPSAERQLNSVAAALSEEFPGTNRGWGVRLTPMHEEIVGRSRPTILVAFGAVAFILLLACANVANLMLARAPSRIRELAVRTALGATPGRVAGQLFIESALLGVASGILGLGIAYGLLELLVVFDAGNLPRLEHVRVDLAVVGFAVGLSAVTSLLCGLAPAVHAVRSSVAATLREGGTPRSGTGAAQYRIRNLFVVAQMAVALVLLAGAGLFATSFRRLLEVDPGFDVQNVLTFRTSLDPRRDEPGYTTRYYDELLAGLANLPSVIQVGAAQTLPMHTVGNDFNSAYRLPGEATSTADAARTQMRIVTPGYFDAIGMTLLSGRALAGDRDPDDPWVAVVNQTMANRIAHGAPAVGRRFELDFRGGWRTVQVVGVAGDTRHYGLRSDPRPEIYLSHRQSPYLAMSVVVKTSGPAAQSVNTIRRALRQLSPAQPAYQFVTMADVVGESIAEERFLVMLLAAFGGVALILASSGVYAVMSYAVSMRTHDIGIRLALGAGSGSMMRQVVARAMALAAVGLVIGGGAAWALARMVENLLFGVAAGDPVTFLGVSILLMSVAVLAAYVPARRAARVDPMVTLRSV